MTYFVTVDYGTRAGNLGTWKGSVEAQTQNEALTIAIERMRKRHYVARIFGGSANV